MRARSASFRSAAAGAAVVAVVLLAGGCGLLSSARTRGARTRRPTSATEQVGRAGAGTRGGPPASGASIGQEATSAMQVARAVAAFAGAHHDMSSSGCREEALRDVTSENRGPDELSHFPLVPDLVQCGGIAVAELPAAASFGPALFVLATCVGSTAQAISSVPTIGGDNWVIWPWYSLHDWMSADLAGQLATTLGLRGGAEPYTLMLRSASDYNANKRSASDDGGDEASGHACYALRGFVRPHAA